MGNTLLKQTKRQLKSEVYSWQTIGVNSFCARVMDTKTKILCEKYRIDFGLVEEEWKTYVLRRNHPTYLVIVYDIIQEQQSNVCSNNQEASVVLEYIPYRLCDLGSISFQEALYVLKCVLEGYKILRQNKIGFYLLDETNICFNRRGKCKFWINQNLYMSKPSPNRIVSEEQFLENLLEIVQPRMSEIEPSYTKKKSAIAAPTLENYIEMIDSQRNPAFDKIPSLSSMSGLTQSQINKLKSISKATSHEKIAANKKISVSKYQSSFRKQKRDVELEFKTLNREKLDCRGPRQSHTSKKLSLSFKWRHQQRKNHQLDKLDSNRMISFVYLSPRKEMGCSPTPNNPESSQRMSIKQWKASYYSPSIESLTAT